MFLLIEERVFLVEYVFWEGNRYTNLAQEQFAEKFPETPVPYHNTICRLAEKFCETRMDITSNTFYKCTATFQMHCIWTS
jgi:hypothetical protein